MDPFLERQPRWEIFHGWFIRKLAENSLPMAVSMGCWIDVERDVYREERSGERVLIGEPDDVFSVSGRDAERSQNGTAVGTVTAPKAVHRVVLETSTVKKHRQPYLVVRDNPEWPRVLAVVELLSPANKEGANAKAYHTKRLRLLASRAHFMEIDFLRGGTNPLREQFPDLEPTPYFVFVARKTEEGRNEEGYPIQLQDPLPTVGLPLWGGRPDLPLDLGAAFRSAYDLTCGGRPIDYRNESVPEPRLSESDMSWMKGSI